MNKKSLFRIVLLLFILGASIGTYMYFKPASTTADGDADFTLQPAQIIQEFETDATAATAKFVGKTVRFGGRVNEMEENNKAMLFKLETQKDDYLAECGFDASQYEKVKEISNGDSLAVQCSCNGVSNAADELSLLGGSTISYSRCKLLEIIRTNNGM